MKTYATASNARRAARAAITDVDKAQEEVHFTIETIGDRYTWRRVQTEAKAPTAPKAEPIAPPAAGEYAEPPEDASQPDDVIDTYVDTGPKKEYRKGAVREVWDICEANQDLRRKDVIAICVSKGINFYTARTQYQAWRTAMKNSGQ